MTCLLLLLRAGHKRTREKYDYHMPEFGTSPEPTPQPSVASGEDRAETPIPVLVDEKVFLAQIYFWSITNFFVLHLMMCRQYLTSEFRPSILKTL